MILSSDQASLKRSSGLSSVIFASLPFSDTMQRILPSRVDVRLTVVSFSSSRSSALRWEVKSSNSISFGPVIAFNCFFAFISSIFFSLLTKFAITAFVRAGSRWNTLISCRETSPPIFRHVSITSSVVSSTTPGAGSANPMIFVLSRLLYCSTASNFHFCFCISCLTLHMSSLIVFMQLWSSSLSPLIITSVVVASASLTASVTDFTIIG